MSRPLAIVTGGASGMGLAACTHLVKRGYRVVIADINKEAGKKLSRELGSDVLFLSCDITHYEEQAALFKRAYDWGGRLDLLAANAGIPDRQSLYQDRASAPMGVNGLPLPLDLKAVEVCLESVIQAIWLFRFFARKSELSDVGKIIVTASAGGLYPMETCPQYTAAKSGVIGLVRSAGRTLFRDDNIALNCICPSFVLTSIVPQEVKDTFPIEHATPISTIMQAYDRFLDDDTLAGQCLEASLNTLAMRDPYPFLNSSQKWIFEDKGYFKT